MFGDIGGVITIIMLLGALLTSFFSERVFFANLIAQSFKMRKDTNKTPISKLEQAKSSFSRKIFLESNTSEAGQNDENTSKT